MISAGTLMPRVKSRKDGMRFERDAAERSVRLERGEEPGRPWLFLC
jgi:hypothetical protein